MFRNNSLTTRIAIGKLIGFFVGIIAFISLPLIAPEVTLIFRIGVLLWYTTFGAIIGVFGVFTTHPVLKFPMPWYFRSAFIGSWLNFVLTLIAYNELQQVIASIFGENGIFVSPFWFVLEGTIIGLIIGYFTTKFGGEGNKIID